jgi:hypothetical protein
MLEGLGGIFSNLLGVGAGIVNVNGGMKDVFDETAPAEKRVAGAGNVGTGAVGTGAGLWGLAKTFGLGVSENGFFSGLAGTSLASEASVAGVTAGLEGSAAAGAVVGAGTNVLGAGLSGFALGAFGDQQMKNWDLLDSSEDTAADEAMRRAGNAVPRREHRSVSDWAADTTRGASDRVNELLDGGAAPGTFGDYAGDAAALPITALVGAGTTVAGAGLAIASANRAIYGGAANAALDGVHDASAAIDEKGLVPAAMDGMGSVFSYFCD